MDYGKILSEAWRLLWRFKALWIFGFITALCSIPSRATPQVNFTFPSNQLPPGLQQWINILARPLVLLTLILLGLIVVVIALLIRSIAEGALIGMVQEAEETGETSFSSGLSTGIRHAAAIFVTDILLSLPVLFFVFLAFIPIVLAVASVGITASRRAALGPAILGALTVVCGILCIAILIGILVYFIRSNALRAIVIDDRGVFGSIAMGWRVFRSHLGDFILLAMVLVILGVIVGLVVGIPLAAIGAVGIVPLFLALARGELLSPALPFTAAVVALLVTVVAAIFNGAVLAYASAVWTLAYRAATGRGQQPVPSPTIPASPTPGWS